MVLAFVIGLVVFGFLVLINFSAVSALIWACVALAVAWIAMGLPLSDFGAKSNTRP